MSCEYFEVLGKKVLEGLLVGSSLMHFVIKVAPDVQGWDTNRFLSSEPSLNFSNQKQFPSPYSLCFHYTTCQSLSLQLSCILSTIPTRGCLLWPGTALLIFALGIM